MSGSPTICSLVSAVKTLQSEIITDVAQLGTQPIPGLDKSFYDIGIELDELYDGIRYTPPFLRFVTNPTTSDVDFLNYFNRYLTVYLNEWVNRTNSNWFPGFLRTATLISDDGHVLVDVTTGLNTKIVNLIVPNALSSYVIAFNPAEIDLPVSIPTNSLVIGKVYLSGAPETDASSTSSGQTVQSMQILENQNSYHEFIGANVGTYGYSSRRGDASPFPNFYVARRIDVGASGYSVVLRIGYQAQMGMPM